MWNTVRNLSIFSFYDVLNSLCPHTFFHYALFPCTLPPQPNTVWGIIAILFYILFPYDLSPSSAAAKSPLSLAFFLERLPLWTVLVFGYTAFWHVALYIWGWADRPFLPTRVYNIGKIAHNLFWSFSGIVIWVGFENVFAYLWASGRMPYVTDEQSFSSTEGITWFIMALLLTPVWRDFHVRIVWVEKAFACLCTRI
jgi:hypothetical protein